MLANVDAVVRRAKVISCKMERDKVGHVIPLKLRRILMIFSKYSLPLPRFPLISPCWTCCSKLPMHTTFPRWIQLGLLGCRKKKANTPGETGFVLHCSFPLSLSFLLWWLRLYLLFVSGFVCPSLIIVIACSLVVVENWKRSRFTKHSRAATLVYRTGPPHRAMEKKDAQHVESAKFFFCRVREDFSSSVGLS